MDNTTTARIDLQRLQILNDRLCQTLDALNQVRLSAHNVGNVGYGQQVMSQGYNLPLNYGYQATQFAPQYLAAQNQFAPQYVPQYAGPFVDPRFDVRLDGRLNPWFQGQQVGFSTWGTPAIRTAPISAYEIERARLAQSGIAYAQPAVW